MKQFFMALVLIIATAMATQLSSAATLNMTLTYNYTANGTTCSVDNIKQLQINPPYIYAPSAADDMLTILNASNPLLITCIGNITNSEPPNSLDDTRGLRIDPVTNIVYEAAMTDQSITLVNVADPKNPTFTGMGSTGKYGATPFSLDTIYEPEYFKVGSQTFVAGAGSNDDVLSIFNATNPASLTNVTWRYSASGTCTMDDIRFLEIDNERGILIAASWTDSYILFMNTSQFATAISTSNITCMAYYTDTADAGTIEAPYQMYYDNTTKLLYVPSYNDHGFTIINISIASTPTAVGTYYNATGYGTPAYRAYGIAAIEKDGQRYVFVLSQGNATLKGNGQNGKLSVFNATNLASIQFIASYNESNGTCNHLLPTAVQIDTVNEMLYYSSYGDDCIYARKIFNDVAPATNTCTWTPGANWVMTDYCNITSSVDICPYNLIVNGTGRINITNGAIIKAGKIIRYPAAFDGLPWRSSQKNGGWGKC